MNDAAMWAWNPTGGPNGTGAWEEIQSSGGAALVTNPNGVVNGGWKVYEVSPPARTIKAGWSFGGDDSFSSALSIGIANYGLFQPIAEMRPDARTLTIISSTANPNYALDIQFSRNMVGSSTDDTYTVATIAGGVKNQVQQFILPASYGWDIYARPVITPTTGLLIKAVFLGRGG